MRLVLKVAIGAAIVFGPAVALVAAWSLVGVWGLVALVTPVMLYALWGIGDAVLRLLHKDGGG